MQRNHFEGNGTLPYGSEGGAINIEHGSSNRIRNNTFINNSVVLRLWWDDDGCALRPAGYAIEGRSHSTKNHLISTTRSSVDANHPFTSATPQRYEVPVLLVPGSNRITFRREPRALAPIGS
jgi:hypothetical protein